ncbi:hypothetical protein D3C84_921230 [compost metagenome]
MHQHADEQQQKAAGEQDEPQLLARQALVFQADVGFGQQRGQVQPLALADANLGDQNRRVERLQAQRVVRPGARQLVELEAAVEDAQVVRTDELQRQLQLLAEALAQHCLHLVDHRALARGLR